MKELALKYGCNPNQKPSKIYMADGSDLPIKVLSGKPGYINFLDAFNGWQLVRAQPKRSRGSGLLFVSPQRRAQQKQGTATVARRAGEGQPPAAPILAQCVR